MADDIRRLRWGGKRVAWGRTLAYGRVLPDFITEMTLGALTVSAEYPSDLPVHVWTGAGDLLLDGITYMGVGPDALEVRVGQASEREDARLQISMSGIDTPELRRAFFEFRGRVIVTVRFIYSNDSGNTWRAVPRFFRGLFSRPQITADQLSFEVATYQEQLDRGYERNWSNRSQEALSPGDLGFEHLVPISEGAELMTRWPP